MQEIRRFRCAQLRLQNARSSHCCWENADSAVIRAERCKTPVEDAQAACVHAGDETKRLCTWWRACVGTGSTVTRRRAQRTTGPAPRSQHTEALLMVPVAVHGVHDGVSADDDRAFDHNSELPGVWRGTSFDRDGLAPSPTEQRSYEHPDRP
jgi:hypothetical protein